MFKKILLILCLVTLPPFIAGKDTNHSKPIYKNPFAWTYGVGTACALAAIHAHYLAEYNNPKDRQVATICYAGYAALFIGGSTTWIVAAKLEQIVCDYFGIENY